MFSKIKLYRLGRETTCKGRDLCDCRTRTNQQGLVYFTGACFRIARFCVCVNQKFKSIVKKKTALRRSKGGYIDTT